MSVSRANLIGGPGKATWNGVTMFCREDMAASFDAQWQALVTSHQGLTDKLVTDRMIKVGLKLWGAWENISVLFPSALLNPVTGTRIFGTSDLPLILHKKTGSFERITIANAQITKLANLYLGVDSDIFSADVEFTGLIKNSGNPEDANSYYTIDTSAYSDNTFAKTNFSRQRYGAVWGASPFDAFQAHKGWNITWDLGLTPEYNANVGTVDMIINESGLNASAACIPLGATIAQIDARLLFQGPGNPLGSLLSDGASDLVITGSTPTFSLTLNKAAITEWKPVMGATPLLAGLVKWETTRSIAAGTGSVIATIV